MFINTNSVVGRMRLLTGDYNNNEDDVWMADNLYTFFYQQANNSELDGAIAALESIINQIALRPTTVRNADASESYSGTVEFLSARLADLKLRKKSSVVPVLIKSDRKNWNDFNELFGND